MLKDGDRDEKWKVIGKKMLLSKGNLIRIIRKKELVFVGEDK